MQDAMAALPAEVLLQVLTHLEKVCAVPSGICGQVLTQVRCCKQTVSVVMPLKRCGPDSSL